MLLEAQAQTVIQPNSSPSWSGPNSSPRHPCLAASASQSPTTLEPLRQVCPVPSPAVWQQSPHKRLQSLCQCLSRFCTVGPWTRTWTSTIPGVSIYSVRTIGHNPVIRKLRPIITHPDSRNPALLPNTGRHHPSRPLAPHRPHPAYRPGSGLQSRPHAHLHTHIRQSRSHRPNHKHKDRDLHYQRPALNRVPDSH